MDIPGHLTSTVALIRRAFPAPLDKTRYFALLTLLYGHMCDECLADTMHLITGRDAAAVTNDIRGVGQRSLSSGILSDVQARLEQAEFSAWLEEP